MSLIEFNSPVRPGLAPSAAASGGGEASQDNQQEQEHDQEQEARWCLLSVFDPQSRWGITASGVVIESSAVEGKGLFTGSAGILPAGAPQRLMESHLFLFGLLSGHEPAADSAEGRLPADHPEDTEEDGEDALETEIGVAGLRI